MRDELFFARGEGFDFHLRPFVADEDGEARAELFGGLELFADFGGGEREIDALSGFAELLDESRARRLGAPPWR